MTHRSVSAARALHTLSLPCNESLQLCPRRPAWLQAFQLCMSLRKDRQASSGSAACASQGSRCRHAAAPGRRPGATAHRAATAAAAATAAGGGGQRQRERRMDRDASQKGDGIYYIVVARSSPAASATHEAEAVYSPLTCVAGP